MVMSHRALSTQQFDLSQHLGLHPSLGGSQVPEVIHGRVARHVMHEADIHQTKRGVDAPHIATSGYAGENREYSYPRGRVMTSQRHLHVPTLKRYAQGDIPERDPDYGWEGYVPEHYHHGGSQWLAEGHHRVVTERLAR
jgi:hypothetical protein